MTRVGLVLGAGGVVGQAYHAGVLAALEHDYGWDPRDAEVIIGTSAGSITGALLRSGVPASELAAWTVRAPLTDEGRILEEMFGTSHPDLAPLRPLNMVLRRPSLPGPGMVLNAIRQPREFRPLRAALSLMGPGEHDIVEQLSALDQMDTWPTDDLWINAVRRQDGKHVVFGRKGAPEAPLHLAVAASCAVPGYFAPVEVGRHTYVDGGAHSPTSADLLKDRDLDLVIVVSPMSGPAALPYDLYGASRLHSARLAAREVKVLRDRGTTVVVFRPGKAEQAAMGNDFLAAERVSEIVQEAFLASGPYAANTPLRDLLGSSAVAS
ncbi:MAG TPA: patatin-like phospholipase family protein [Nocardioidaceae bacterium]|nr:patatin-like phospholipase family protein [Nocardioidaceae bacterium]